MASSGRLAGVLSAALFLIFTQVQAVEFTSQLVTNLPVAGGSPCDSFPSAGAAFKGYFYFAATDGSNGVSGRELWRTDGTSGGTALFMDICPGAGDSSPANFVAAGSNLFFSASDGVHGQQLWRSDGTLAGTFPITAFPTNASIAEVTAIGNGACFVKEIDYLPTLYRTDGTADGTFALTGPGGFPTTNELLSFDVSGTNIAFVTGQLDYYGYPTNSILWRFSGTGPYFTYQLTIQTNQFSELHIIGTNCYFVIASNYTEVQAGLTNLYYSELLCRTSIGTPSTTVQTVDSTPPAFASSGFYDFSEANGYLFYSWLSVDYGYFQYIDTYGPWKTIAPSGAITAITTNGSGSEQIIGKIGSTVYYWDRHTGFFRTDGASSGVAILDVGPLGFTPKTFQQAGSDFFFMGTTPHSANGLGVTDLTSGGTREMTNAAPGPNSNLNAFMGALSSLALYDATDDQIGDEPYRSDGTTSGTFLLRDIATGTNTPPPAEGVASGGLFYFTLDTPATGVELWRSDGTAAGTTLVKDIRTGTNSSAPSQLTAWNGLLFFAANDGTNGNELWRSDGTAAGTYMVKDIWPGAADSNPTNLTPAGSELFFVADDGSHGPELWATDGTRPGTVLVQDIEPGAGSGNIRSLGAVGTNVYFLAGPTNTSGQLWFSAGPSAGAQFLYDFGTLTYPEEWARDYTSFGGKVYFGIYPPSSPWLAESDGTPGGTGFVTKTGGVDIATAGGVLFTTTMTNLLTTDGTYQGTVVVTNLPNGISQLTPIGSQLYFVSDAALWISDGTVAGTYPVAQFPNPSEPVTKLTPFQGTLIFSADSQLLGRELWATAPGQGATLIEDLSPQTGDDHLQLISAASNQVFYVAKPAGQTGWELRTLHLQSGGASTETPYGGVPWPVPGLIEAENFNLGGDGVAYHDTTPYNEGGVYRPYEGVDIEACNDTNGGFCVFDTQPGEWMDYTVNAAYSGLYQIEIRLTSAAQDTGMFHFEVDGVQVLDEGVLNNGSPDSWVTIVDAIPFSAGVHVLRVVFDEATSAGDVGIYNWFDFAALETNEPPVVSITYPPAGGIISTNQPVSLQAQVNDPTSWTPPVVQFFVDGQLLGTCSNSPYAMTWEPTPGTHTVSASAVDYFGSTGASSNVTFYVAQPYLVDGSFWRADVFGTNLPVAWRQPGYDDSHWPHLRAPFGFGYEGVRTLIPSNFNNTPIPTFYFRQTFSNSLSSFNAASLTLSRDDAAVIWINGQQLARLNLPQPPTNVVFTTLAITNVFNNVVRTNPAMDVIPIPLSMLVDGTNVIAVEIHQGEPLLHDNFDLYFDLSFSTYFNAPEARLTISSASNNVNVSWSDLLTGWTLLQSPDLSSWSAATGALTDSNGLFNLTLPAIQRGFFRLQNTNGP